MRRIIGLAALLLVACNPTLARLPDTPPRFEAGPCWGGVPRGVVATCGTVSVPEDRGRAMGAGNTVRLAVVVLEAEGVEAPGPPTFFLGGGPGQDVIGLFAQAFTQYQTLLDEGFPPETYQGQRGDSEQFKVVMDLLVADLHKRPFVYFDQRGAGYSQPSLKCRGEPWEACRRRLVAEGVDLAAYTTLANAQDVDAIRQALGYAQINLQGGSYGTRLALEVMRAYPETLRAVVLDGVAPPQIDWAAEMVGRYDDALEVLFAHCRADAACNGAYPELEATFYRTVERLNERPLKVRVGDHTERLNGDDLRDMVWNGLYDTQKIRFLPLLIAEASAGRSAVWGGMLEAIGAGQAGDPIAWGMHYAVECAERWPFETPEQIAAAGAGLHPAIRDQVVAAFSSGFVACAAWDVPIAPAVVHSPVTSDIPTLLLSGEFDPGTPPAFAELTAATLSRHYSYVLPYLGHCDGFFSGCHAALISAFLDDPSRAPDAGCIAALERAPFVR